MQMKMVDRLSAVGAGIDDDAITIGQSLFVSYLRRGPVQVAEQGALVLARIDHGRDVLARDDKDVDRGLGVDVGESVAQLILVDGRGGNFTLDDPAKKAAHSQTSVHGGDGRFIVRSS